jgi:hypothetical protein
MSVSTEVQRTLVKSPPELWSELSNPEALARHLADLGEIRITSVEPETKLEWAAEGASGVVHLKQSGWGTRVTLSVTRAAPVSEQASEAEPSVTSEPELVAKPEPQAPVEPDPEPEIVAVEVASESIAESNAEPITEPEPEPRLGLFARLFRRRRTRPHEIAEAQSEHKAAAAPEPVPEIEIVALAAPEPIYPERPVEPAADLAAELESVEAQMAEEATELLTGVLDRLGAAHHRPFSRG